MNIRTYTVQDTVFASSRLRLPREVNANMEKWNKLAHTFHARVTFIPGMERPIGPLGNYIQPFTVTIEGDCDDPKCQQLFDAIYSNDPKKLEQIKMELRTGSLTDDASNTTNVVDQSTARNTQKHAAPLNRAIAVNSSDTAPLIKRIFMFLEDGEWDRVNEYCETVLDLDPENAHAYLGMLMADLKVSHVKDLKDQAESFAENKNYQKAVRYADEKLKAGLIGCINHINTRNENERLEGLYISAIEELNTVSNSEKNVSEQSIKKIAEQFEAISHYKDAADKARECYKKIEEIRLEKKRQEEIAREEEVRKEEARQKTRSKALKISIIIAPVALLLLAVLLLVNNVVVPNDKYKDAMALMDAGKYEDAVTAFEALNGYKDSLAKVEECNTGIFNSKYDEAVSLMNSGNYDEAISRFEALSNNQFSTVTNEEYLYNYAMALRGANRFAEAAIIYGKVDTSKDAYSLSLKFWNDVIEHDTISTGRNDTIGLKKDGTVVAVGANDKGECNTYDWSDIIDISIYNDHSVGLKADGTVIATGWNEFSQCDVSEWTDIVDVSVGASHTVGLKKDGTVIAIGSNSYGQCDISNWTDIIAICAGSGHTVALKVNGDVVAVGRNNYGQCDVQSWHDIVAIAADEWHTVALKADGTVVAAGYNDEGQCNVSQWRDIIAVDAGYLHTVGLKSDGTVIAVGKNLSDQCNVSNWDNIVAISAGDYHTIGLKSDGTVVATISAGRSACDVSAWKDIKLSGK